MQPRVERMVHSMLTSRVILQIRAQVGDNAARSDGMTELSKLTFHDGEQPATIQQVDVKIILEMPHHIIALGKVWFVSGASYAFSVYTSYARPLLERSLGNILSSFPSHQSAIMESNHQPHERELRILCLMRSTLSVIGQVHQSMRLTTILSPQIRKTHRCISYRHRSTYISLCAICIHLSVSQRRGCSFPKPTKLLLIPMSAQQLEAGDCSPTDSDPPAYAKDEVMTQNTSGLQLELNDTTTVQDPRTQVHLLDWLKGCNMTRIHLITAQTLQDQPYISSLWTILTRYS